MVAVAVAHPSVGIVSAYRLNEDRVDLDGLPYPSTFVTGRTAGRLSLGRRQLFLFGSPTSILLRADLVRSAPNFYDETRLHADTDACFRLLLQSDFGFVHQVLTYTRRHNESITSKVKRLETIHAELAECFMRYGPQFLDADEFRVRRREVEQGYYRMLARHVTARSDAEFWRYHAQQLAAMGMPLQWRRLLRPLLLQGVDALVHCRQTARNVAAVLHTARHTLPRTSHTDRREVASGD
jgi:hypothetical protein